MVLSGFQLPSQRRDSDGHILTHGFVHGHVHQHKDHVHIHGHIHNHDHIEKNDESIACGGEGAGTSDQVPNKEVPEIECKELDDSFDLCSGILCDDLDDCYYYDCDRPGLDSMGSVGSVGSSSGLDSTASIGPKDSFHGSRNRHVNFCETGHCEEIGRGGTEGGSGDGTAECCEDESCLMEPSRNICTDTVCIDTDHHDNSLCALQKPRLPIFEDLIQNVHRNIEQFAGLPIGSSGSNVESVNIGQNQANHIQSNSTNTNDFHIHFPHHCHQGDNEQSELLHGSLEHVSVPQMPPPQSQPQSQAMTNGNPVLPNMHTMHQSCFHARIPIPYSSKTPFADAYKPSVEVPSYKNDYDFFAQFNNFKQIFPDDMSGEVHESMSKHTRPNVSQSPRYEKISELTNNQFHQPHTFSCQWENCLQSVDNGTLLTHLLGSHLGHEPNTATATENSHTMPSLGPTKLECEWDDCGFVDDNIESFMDHLNTHKTEVLVHNDISPILTPSSIGPISESPYLIRNKVKDDSSPKKRKICKTGDCGVHKKELTHHHAFSISEMRIAPKNSHSNESLDPLHRCKWQIGTDSETGHPIICNEQHSTEGDLQEHLKTIHIGKGKSIYHCCWENCERNNGKPFSQRQKLFRHIHIHTGHKPCTCDICGACFAVPSMLKQHQRIHSGEKPYKCQECGRAFTTSSSLAIHTRVHTDSRPLKCTWPGCEKRFRESSNLAKHLRTHSTTYTCYSCGKKFDKRREYTRHLKSHPGGGEDMGNGEFVKEEAKPDLPELIKFNGSPLQT